MQDKTLDLQEYNRFRDYLENQCGIVLGDNKQYLVKSRLSPLMRKFDIDSLSNLVDKAVRSHDRNLKTAVIDAMTTNETLWFRDNYPFELFTSVLLPEFKGQRTPIKIWSAACSSGQEPYSISMKFAEYQQRNPGNVPGGVQILGTDISTSMLDQCRSAEYDSLSLARGLSEDYKRLYFEPGKNGTMKLKPSITKCVSFRQMNLLDSYSLLGKFDIIFCRNVLIYFSADVKAKILQQFAASLNPGGFLFLGASESMSGLSDAFEMRRCNPGIVYKKK